jgi:hypothetical protein
MPKIIVKILDSSAFRIFFAAWTGVYLVQVIKGESGGPGVDELWWIMIAFAVALFLL